MAIAPGNLFILSAPSGGGKSSLIRALLEKHQDMQVSVSHTSRQPRPGENDGEHYHFVDQSSFKQLIADGVFLEWAEVFGNFYGTSSLAIQQQLDAGIDVFLDIDWQGAQQIRRQLSDVTSIFIMPPSRTILETRLQDRGQDSKDVIAGRMEKARAEMSHYEEFDYLIVNDQFEEALTQLETIVLSARLKRPNQSSKHATLLNELLAND